MTLLAALMLGGCMQATLAPTPEASWKTRDRELMSNLPYKQAAIPEEFRRHCSYLRLPRRNQIAFDAHPEVPSAPLRYFEVGRYLSTPNFHVARASAVPEVVM
jgi:hypothetical protein